MDPDDQSLFVVASVENADPSTFRQTLQATPEIVVFEVLRRWALERKDLAPLRINAGHHMLDRAIFSRGVHRLKDEQDRPLILRIKHVLQFCKYFNTSFQQFFCPWLVFGGDFTGIVWINILEPKLLAIGNAVRRDEFLA